MSLRTHVTVVLIGAAFTALGAAPAAQRPAPVTPVEPAALEALLPESPGWTRAAPRGNVVTISATCSYSFAAALFTRGEARVRVTLVDSGYAEESLIAMATMVVTLPEGHAEALGNGATIRRFVYKSAQAAERWDPAEHEGEVTVLVDGRFIAKAEGTGLESAEALRALLDLVDLKKLAALK